ncbi:MAG: alpha/beta hydrolase [Actinomycetota bacterium]|nr:alpha/beta hydrolase [Actinomycetota bacterium]
MSTPPRVDLPDGVTVERWSIRGSERAVMRTDIGAAEAWAVLVPGFTGSKEDFIAVLPLLAEAGVGALAYDHLGQHESHPSHVEEDYDLALLAADLGEVIAQASARFDRTDGPHLVGHSFGGLVAQRTLVDGHVRPASFVALCTGPGALPPARWQALPDLVDALPHTDLGAIWAVMRAADRAAGATRPPDHIEEFLERRWLATSPVHLRQLGRALMEQPSMTLALQAVVDDGVPVTVMWGERDDAWPIEDQVRMADELGVPAVQIPGAGHSPNADSPHALVEYLLAAWGR